MNGHHDPTTRIAPGRVLRATLGPSGPSVLEVVETPDAHVTITDWVTGSTTEMSGHPLLGDADPGHRVQPVHEPVARALERFGNHRIAVTGTPYHDLLPAVLAQRVTAREAVSQWDALCRRWGDPVEAGPITLFLPPRPEVLADIPYHELHRLGIDRRRADTLRNVARHGNRLISGWKADLTAHERTLSLQLIPGVGQWTAAVAGWTSFGDADALEVGDFHAKNTVVYALTGRHRGTDEEMSCLLEPYAGDRQRVLQWLRMDGHSAPAHGPRKRIVSIARL